MTRSLGATTLPSAFGNARTLVAPWSLFERRTGRRYELDHLGSLSNRRLSARWVISAGTWIEGLVACSAEHQEVRRRLL